MHLDIPQMLRFGGVNALVGNADAPLGKDNNFYWYDYAAGPRVYFPWDLDTTMRETPAIFGAPGATLYTDVLFSHWEDDYDALLTEMLAGPLTLDAIRAELARVEAVAADALDGDPLIVGDSAADVLADLDAWWSARHAQVAAELETHAP
jgi:spore coat protein CotH